jgi:predicted RNA-binding protein with PUA-like domain
MTRFTTMRSMSKRYWLMKTEPETFSIDDLMKRPNQTEGWDGVRNYQARNHMRDMQVGDGVLFYHSSSDPIGVAGEAVIAAAAAPDETALNPKSPYHDPKATPDKNPWVLVKVKLVQKFKGFVTLETLKHTPGLENMLVIKKGMRLSVQPVTAEEFHIVKTLGKLKSP